MRDRLRVKADKLYDEVEASGTLRCNGICMSGWDVDLPYSGVAYPHPDCEEHGDGFYNYLVWKRRQRWDQRLLRWLGVKK